MRQVISYLVVLFLFTMDVLATSIVWNGNDALLLRNGSNAGGFKTNFNIIDLGGGVQKLTVALKGTIIIVK